MNSISQHSVKKNLINQKLIVSFFSKEQFIQGNNLSRMPYINFHHRSKTIPNR